MDLLTVERFETEAEAIRSRDSTAYIVLKWYWLGYNKVAQDLYRRAPKFEDGRLLSSATKVDTPKELAETKLVGDRLVFRFLYRVHIVWGFYKRVQKTKNSHELHRFMERELFWINFKVWACVVTFGMMCVCVHCIGLPAYKQSIHTL